jgi:DNA invertase Pin-like site-specific DNA recombinase
MFEHARLKRFDRVLFWALDRFAREGTLKTLEYLQRLDSYGVAWKSFTEQYLDSTGMFRDAVIAILATIAKQEHERLSCGHFSCSLTHCTHGSLDDRSCSLVGPKGCQ